MARIEGIPGVLGKLAQKLSEAQKDGKEVSVVVGYTASYAIWVHENREIWPPGMRLAGQARGGLGSKGEYWDPQNVAQPEFLAGPMKANKDQYRAIINAALKGGKTLKQALLLAGLRLMADSQRLTPVDTGALRASAFVRVEESK